MRGIKPFKLGFFTRPFQWGPTHHLGVSVTAFFAFDPPGTIHTDVEMWDMVAKELGAVALDVGVPKSRAEVLVVGRCFQPGGALAPTCPVRVTVGRIDKAVSVIGDREWERGVPTPPIPFREMPLDWEHAFGGEGFAPNPLGKGAAPVTDEQGRERHPLPNIESPPRLVRSPKERPDPVGLRALELHWPQRMGMSGTYDKEWLDTRYPGFAKDMDWRMWNMAPADQQQEAPFVGNERVVLENLHPKKPHLEAHLPNLRGRAFITRRPAITFDLEPDEAKTIPDTALEEVELRLTTVWLFPHLEKGVVIFQGATVVQEDDATDVSTIMVAAERVDARLPFAHYQRQFELRTGEAAKDNPAIFLNDDGLVPTDQLGFPPESMKELELLKNEGLQAKRLKKQAASAIDEGRKKLEALGLPPDEHGPTAMPADPEVPAIDQMPALLAKLSEMLSEQRAAAEVKREEQTAIAAKFYAEHGLDFDEVREEMKTGQRGPPTFTADGMITQLAEIAASAKERGQPLDELEHYATSTEWTGRLRENERQLVETYRLAAHFQDPAFPMEPVAANAVREAVEQDLRAGRSLARQDFTGAHFDGMDLRGADLTGTFLESASLEGAQLEGARLDGAVLAHANLSQARLAGASLRGTNLGKANLRATDLSGLDLSAATLYGADMGAASLAGACLDGAALMNAKLDHANLRGARAHIAMFLEASLAGVSFAGADLTQSIFYKVGLEGVDFGGATLDGVTFIDCRLDRASFVNAHMHEVKSMGEETSWREVDLRGAQLKSANLRGVDLTKSDFSGANLDRADLSGARLREARFYRAVARESMWVKSDLRGAFMVSIDLLRSILQKADLRGTDLRGANLYAADFALIRSDEKTNVTDANQIKVRTLPRREPPR